MCDRVGASVAWRAECYGDGGRARDAGAGLETVRWRGRAGARGCAGRTTAEGDRGSRPGQKIVLVSVP